MCFFFISFLSDPPSLPSFSIGNVSVFESVKIIEGTGTLIKCSSESEPAPFSYLWTFSGGTHDGEFLFINIVTKLSDGPHSCMVRNEMIPTGGDSVTGENTNVVLLDVLCTY